VRIRTLAVVAATMLVSITLVPPAEATAGAEHWLARFPGPGYSVDQVAGIAIAPDGSRLFVTGSVAHFTGATIQTVAYDAAGTQLWHTHFKGTGPYDDSAAQPQTMPGPPSSRPVAVASVASPNPASRSVTSA